MDIGKIFLLTIAFILHGNSTQAQMKRVDYVKQVFGGELKGVKTAKVYYFNAQFGDIKTSVAEGKHSQMIEQEQDIKNRILYKIHVRTTTTGLDTTHRSQYKYEFENEHIESQYEFKKWPNTREYYLKRKEFTSNGLLKAEEKIETDKEGNSISYKKIFYEYDNQNRLSQRRDSASNRYSWNDFEEVSKYEQIITTYHYDTLGVKCFITEDKVDNLGFEQPVSRAYISDSIGKNNRKYYYKLTDAYYIASEYIGFDKRKNQISHQYFRINHRGDVWYADSSLVKSIYSTYNSHNQITNYENKLEGTSFKYVYNANHQLIERSGNNMKERFRYDRNGNIVEYIEDWRGSITKYVYADYNKIGIAETVTYYNAKGEIALITKREFTYW